MKTKLCEELGMTLPLFAFTRSPEVVVAVSRAGGMGVQAAIGFSLEELRRCLDYIEANVGGRPYGVDVVMPSGFVQPDGTAVKGGGAMASAADYQKALPPSTSASSTTSSRSTRSRSSPRARPPRWR